MPTFHLPVPGSFTLANGLKVYVLEDHALPVLSATVVSRAGSETNPHDKGGLATLTAEVMGDGTKTMNLEQLAEAQEAIGTAIRPNASMDSASSGLTVLNQNSARGMQLLSDVVEHPGFREADLDRRKKQRLVRIKQETDNVQQMAFRVGPKLVYGDQPYGAAPTGTTESVTSLGAGEVEGFYKEHYGPRDSALAIAGDVTMEGAKKLAEQYFGGWSGEASSAVTMPPAPSMQATHVVIVDKPGAPQTALFAFGLGVPANSPDLPTLRVADYTLGGSFGSRINMNLREEHGYTYGAQSGFRNYRAGGDFLAGGLIRTDVTGNAATELMKEIRNFPSNPPSADELTKAKTAETQSLPGAFETTAAQAGSLASLYIYDRPLTYYADLPAKYGAVTSADVARVAKEDVHPGELVIVAAGDRTKIEPQLKAANLGPVEVRDINGNLVTAAAGAGGGK